MSKQRPMQKSILLIGNYPPPFGGVPVHLEYLAPYLASHGWEVNVLPIKMKQRNIQDMGDFTQYSRSPVTRKVLVELYLKNAWRIWNHGAFFWEDRALFNNCLTLAKRAEEIARNYNVGIISAYHIFPAGMAGAWLARELAIPLVVSIFGEIYGEFALHERRRREVQHVVDFSQKLLSCSVHCAKSLERLGMNAEVEVIPYGIDTTNFSPETDGTALMQRLGLTSDDKVVTFVGRLTKEMGLHTLLESIPQVLELMPHIRFVIVGGSAELLEPARNLSNKYKKNVFVFPDVPREDLPQYYAMSTIAVVPSINVRACQGLAAAEALASGKPVIIANVGGGPEVVTGECGRLVPPENPLVLTESIMSLIEDRASIQLMGRLGRARAIAYFDQEKLNQQLELIFSQVLETSCRNH